MSARGFIGKIGITIVVASVALGVRLPVTSAQVTANGVLDQETEAVLDLDASGLPDILDGRNGVKGAAFFRLDGIRDADIEGSFADAGPDGFRDAGYSDIPTACTDCQGGRQSVRSSLNTGKLTIIYLADSDGIIGQCSGASSNPGDPCTKDADCPGGACTVDLAADDSLFYVGLDIYNGDPRDVGNPAGVEDVDYHHIDFVDTVPFGDICQDGVADFDSNGIPDFIAVPFDVDGDGQPLATTRWDAQPTQPCQPDDVAEVDLSGEQYRVFLYLCAPLQEELDSNPNTQLPANIGQLFVSLEDGSPVVDSGKSSNLVLPAGTSLGDFFQSYPNDGVNVSQIQGDIEFVVRRVDTLIHAQCGRGTFPPVNCTGDFALDRLQFARGGVRTMSDSDADGSDEDFITATWFAPIPEIEVTKKVRCEGETEWDTTVEGLPGSTIEFKIEVENTGNVELAVCLEDLLEEVGTASVTPVDDSLTVMLHRPSGGPGVPLDFINAAGFGLNRDFFGDPLIPGDQGFLDHLDGACSYLGVLRGVDVCDEPANPVLGDRVVITFQATVDETVVSCDPTPPPVDVKNSVTAIGDPDLPPGTALLPPDGNETRDVHGIVVGDTVNGVDTNRENAPNQGFDDNVVSINILCRDIDFTKEVGFPGNEASFTAGHVPLDLLTDPAMYPLGIEYRYRVTNNGEVDENVTVTDSSLCQDIATTPGAIYIPGQCDLCQRIPVGQVSGTAPKLGGSPAFSSSCRVRLADLDTALRFMGADDDEDCQAPEDPPITQVDLCYRNCANVSATPDTSDGICTDGELGADSFSEICIEPGCELDVTKQVKCADDPDGEYVARKETFAGEVLNFRSTVTNVGRADIALVCLEDTLSCAEWLRSKFIAKILDAAGVERADVTALLQGRFVFDGTRECFVLDPPLAPDEKLVIFFNVQVPADYAVLSAAPECQNCFAAEGYTEPDADPTEPAEEVCAGEDCAEIEVLVSDMACEKTVCAVDAAGVGYDCSDSLTVDTNAFPVTLTYQFAVGNPAATSEMPLRNVRICDPGLVADANGSAPDEVHLGQCHLDPTMGCADLNGIPVGGSEVAECTVIVPSYEAWRVFASLDGSDQTCYENSSEASGEPDAGDDVCGEDPLGTDCDARVCIPPPCLCDVEVLKEACIKPPPNGGGGEGCTPGFWKNHLDAWPAGIGPNDDFDTVFGVEAFDPNISLIEALNRGGGGVSALGRHATSALLNATSGDVDYAMTVVEVIAAVQAALSPGGDIEGTKDQLASFNEEGCPIGRGGRREGRRVTRGKSDVGLPEPTECLPAIPCGTPTEVEFRYTVFNPTDCALTNVRVIDDVFGEIPGSPIAVLGPGERVVLTLVVTLSEEMTNTVTVTANVGGETCDATSTVIVPDDCTDGGLCRMTGGGVEGTVPPHSWLEVTNGNNHYTFGGQAGAPTASQPQPWGEWTHRQHSGDDGRFTFHAGTASAPEDTEIDLIECHDPDNCNPARPAPFKQLDFEGVGSFRNIAAGAPVAPFVTRGQSLHWFEVHVEDLGEPGNYDPEAVPCPVGGHVGLPPPANCGCPDFYSIRIHATEDPGSQVIYEVSGYINGGNLQIHPAIGE